MNKLRKTAKKYNKELEFKKMETPVITVINYPIPGKRYRHYKGGIYKVITLATHSETGEKQVVYKSELFGDVTTRPLSMWFEEIIFQPSNKLLSRKKVQRFTLIED